MIVALRISGAAPDLLVSAFAALASAGVGAEPASEEEVRAWVRAAQDGDPQAAPRIYRAYVSKIYRTVRPICRDDAEAEDVTQETFARALEALDTYAPRAGARFVSWLLAIALNVARKSHRRRARLLVTDRVPDDDALETDDPAGDALDERRLRAALLAGMERLEPRAREVVTLRYGGELNAKEIAELTGLGHDHVRKIAQRARGELRGHIERMLAPRRPILEEAR